MTNKMYHWSHGDLADGFLTGDIVIMAQSIEHAREKVVAFIDKRIEASKNTDDHVLNLWGYKDYHDQWKERVAEINTVLQKYLEREPLVTDGVVLIKDVDN